MVLSSARVSLNKIKYTARVDSAVMRFSYFLYSLPPVVVHDLNALLKPSQLSSKIIT